MKKASIPLLAALALFTACDDNPASPTPTPEFFLEATVTADGNDTDYMGLAQFHVGTPPGGGSLFQIVSIGDGGLADRGFAITSFGTDRLTPGTYPIELVDVEEYRTGGMPEGILLQYGRTVATADPRTFLHETPPVEQLFVAESGTLTITVSTPERVEGTFTATGFQYCPVLGPDNAETGEPCDIPTAAPENAPRLTVEGRFVAEPLDDEFWPMPDEG